MTQTPYPHDDGRADAEAAEADILEQERPADDGYDDGDVADEAFEGLRQPRPDVLEANEADVEEQNIPVVHEDDYPHGTAEDED